MRGDIANRVVFALALAGLGVAGYLTLAHLNVVDLGCTAVRGCEEVAQHETARGFGIPWLRAVPTAAFGLLGFGSIATLCFVRTLAAPAMAARIRMLQLAVAATAVGVSGWLTYLEAFVIHAWCQWCVASAIITVLVLATLALERAVVPPDSPTGSCEDRP